MRKIGKFSGARLRAYAVLISPFCGDAPRRAAIRSLTEYPSCPSDAVAASILTAEAQETARALRVQLQIVKAGAEGDFETDFAYLAQLHVDGLTVGAEHCGDALRETRPAFIVPSGRPIVAAAAVKSIS